MSTICKHCGSILEEQEEQSIESEERDFGRWFCIRGFCGKNEESVLADAIISIPNGKYERRKTIHFELDEHLKYSSNSKKGALESILKRSPLEGRYGNILPPSKSPIKVLLVFPYSDAVGEVFTLAAEKLCFDATLICTDNEALEQFQSKAHDLVIIDTRSVKGIDFGTLCRSIRNTKGSQHTVIVGVVKKQVFEKDEKVIQGHLESGFNRKFFSPVHCRIF
ncbi:unnamed protein product [Brassicogethes aeneus]|uniref:PDE8-like REC N-terminal domain-containing protein n=1 Tax=Brassicogethes aeneus TaxID=1431903 RepID=A0A9P0B1Y9_BRAAE|nr:unnamed protein product [Brassicogethes aeneus]